MRTGGHQQPVKTDEEKIEEAGKGPGLLSLGPAGQYDRVVRSLDLSGTTTRRCGNVTNSHLLLVPARQKLLREGRAALHCTGTAKGKGEGNSLDGARSMHVHRVRVVLCVQRP